MEWEIGLIDPGIETEKIRGGNILKNPICQRRLNMTKRSKLLFLLLIILFVPACIFNSGYQEKNGTYVYVLSYEGTTRDNPIEGVDPETFVILDKHGYAKDKLRVYYEGVPVEGADPASFEDITDDYGKDATQVYYQFRAIPGADPATFNVFNIQWGRDANDIYLQDRPIEACDPDTFVLLDGNWERDDKCVYRNWAKLEDADPASFVVLNFWFAKDKNHVYSNDLSIIEGADPATFKVQEVCKVCGQDKNGCYQYDKKASCPQP
jgi:hypothetical protein